MTESSFQSPSRLSRLSVFQWTASPLVAILLREVLVALRHRRQAHLLIGLSAALLFIILTSLIRISPDTAATANAVDGIVGIQCSALLLILFLVTPALSAVMVASERDDETADLIHMALGDPLSLLVGKTLAMLALFSVFHIALMPFSTFTFFFAGIALESFFQITFMLYGTAICHSILGVTISASIGRPNGALGATLLLLTLLYGIPIWLGAPMNPLRLLGALLDGTAGWRDCMALLGLQGIGVVLAPLLCWSASRCYRTLKLPPFGERSGTVARSSRPCGHPIPDWGSPTYHKDCHTSALTRPGWSMGFFTLGTLVAIAFTLWSAYYTRLSFTPFSLGTFLIIVVTPLLVLKQWSRDTNPATLTMLRMTRIGSTSILFGKALATLRCLSPLVAGIIVGGVLSVLLLGPTFFSNGHPSTPTIALYLYQAALLPLKLFLGTSLCVAATRFKSPGATDIAIALILSVVLVGGAEFVRAGLFEPANPESLNIVQLTTLYFVQFVCASFGSAFILVIALMRFEAVFDGSLNEFATPHVDRNATS